MMAKYLIDNKLIDLNYQDYKGMAPIFFSIYHNKTEITKLLLKEEIDVNIMTHKNITAI